MDVELKPCPFCGGEARLSDVSPYFWTVNCTECETEGAPSPSSDESVSAWNTRHGAGDAEDAARYRFLRECRSDEIYVMAFDPEGDAPCCGGEIMDAAIDAARAGERGSL